MVEFIPAPDPELAPAPLSPTVPLNPPMVGLANPFEHVDGQNRDLILEAIRAWSRGPLTQWTVDWAAYLVQWFETTKDWLDTWDDATITYVTAKVAEIKAYVDAAVVLIIEDGIQVQDAVVAGIIRDIPESETVQALKEKFVDIPVPGDIKQNGLTGMVHVPAIPYEQDGGAFIQAYIDAMEAGPKGTAPLGTGLYFMGGRYRIATRIKNKIKAFDWHAATRAKFTTLQNRYGYGGLQLIIDIPDADIGNAYVPAIDVGATEAEATAVGGPYESVSFFSGVTWNDISIVGREHVSDPTDNKSNYPAVDALRFNRFGWDCRVNGLWVRRFAASGVVFNQVYDSAWNDMTVTGCGGVIAGQVHYAMEYDSSNINDVCNAMKFKSLHMEACRYYMRFTRARHISFFGGSKWEQNNYFTPVSFDTDITNAPIYFGASAMELTFTDSYFIGAHVGLWSGVNPGTPPADIPYFIKSDANRVEGTSAIQFNGCTFTNGRETEPVNKRGVKWMTGTNLHIRGGHMDYATTEAPALNLTKSVVDGLRVVLGTYGHANGGSAYPITLNGDSAANNIHLSVSGGTAKFGIVLNGDRTTASLALPPVGIERPVVGGGSIGGGFRPLSGVETINDAGYIAKYGGAVVPYAALVIDSTRHVQEVLDLSFGANNVTITDMVISANTRGRSILFYNSGTGTVTITAATNREASTMAPGESRTYRLATTKWVVV